MSRLINEDWEHASRAADEGFHALHQQYIMEAEYQEWEANLCPADGTQKPAIINLSKPIKDEATHNARKVRGAHQEKL